MPEKITIVQVGGNIESAVKGNYHIDVNAILTEAWQSTLKSRMSINSGLLFSFLLGMLIAFVGSHFLGGMNAVISDPNATLLINFVITIAVWPFLAGVEMMGVSHAVGMKTPFTMTFAFLQRASWVVLSVLISSVIMSIGFQLFFLPGVFLTITLSLTIPLVIEKKMNPMKAIIVSVQALRFKFLPLLYLYIILLIALLVLIIPSVFLFSTNFFVVGLTLLFIGLSFLAPLFYNVKGILYREIFGISISSGRYGHMSEKADRANTASGHDDSDDTFSA